MTSKDYIKDIVLNGSSEDKLSLYAFTVDTPVDKIVKKFKIYARANYPRYFTSPQADFHDEHVKKLVVSYLGSNELEAGFRGAAKTALAKLFVAYVLQNDRSDKPFRSYLKVVSKELTNAKQMVTDVYNLLVETTPLYGDLFENTSKIKREETMGSFTMANGVKVASGTVGQDQRGHLQDAFRPDWILFEDVEDRSSISSQVQTQKIILKCQEAIDGLAKTGNYFVNCNYISEDGTIQWFMNKPSVNVGIIPIAEKVVYGSDEMGKKHILSAVPTWNRYSLDDLNEIYKDAEDWYGEYMCDPARSDDKFFDINIIDRHIENHAKDSIRQSAGFHYWDVYKPQSRYGAASDHSEGIGRDANTFCLFDFRTGELVVTYASNTIEPSLAARENMRIGREFGNCIIAPEINNTCGGTVITTMKEDDYPSIYRLEVKDKVGNTLTNRLGWHTNSKSKTTMLMDFRRDFEDGLIIIYDINLLKEMRSYSTNDLTDRTTGLVTRHFDLLMAACIGWQMKDLAGSQSSVADFYKNLKRSGTGSATIARS